MDDRSKQGIQTSGIFGNVVDNGFSVDDLSISLSIKQPTISSPCTIIDVLAKFLRSFIGLYK